MLRFNRFRKLIYFPKEKRATFFKVIEIQKRRNDAIEFTFKGKRRETVDEHRKGLMGKKEERERILVAHCLF